MKNERLEQIRDSIDFQLSAEKNLKIDKEIILEEKELLDYITNLQEENERLKKLKERYQLEKEVYKSRNEKANWWLKEMLKQAKSDETKAIINGTLELLLNGGDEE